MNDVNLDDLQFTLDMTPAFFKMKQEPDMRRSARVWPGDAIDVFDSTLYRYPDAPSDEPHGEDKLDEIRRYWSRQFDGHDSIAVIEVDIFTTDQFELIQLILKQQTDGEGIHYIGQLSLALKGHSVILKIESREAPSTPDSPHGMRDATVLAGLVSKGQLEFKPGAGEIKGWTQHPYLPERTSGFLRNLADSEEYDEAFPEHPLTRVRAVLRHLRSNLKVNPRLKPIAMYLGPKM